MLLRAKTTISLGVLVLALLSLALAVSGCTSDDSSNAIDRRSVTAVGWPQVVSLVRDCRAKRVDQTHSRLVTVTLRDGRKVWAREPRIDAIGPVVNRANARCGPITFSTE